jgi:hypothetical protein
MGWQVQPPPIVLTLVPVAGTPFVQSAGATGASVGTITATFANPVTPGNSVICGVVDSAASPTVTPSSGPDTFTLDSNTGGLVFFHVSGSAGGYTGVNLNGSAATMILRAYEVASTCTFDTHTAATGVAGAFSVNYTPAVAGEFLVGISDLANAGGSLTTSPGLPWTNNTPVAAGAVTSLQSYQFSTTTGVVPFTGQWSPSVGTTNAVAGYKLATPGTPATPTNGCVLYYYSGQLIALGESGIPVVLATT